MHSLYLTLAANLAAILVAMTSLWLVSLRLRDVSIVDMFWGPGFALVALLSLLLAPARGTHALLLAALCTTWGLRLGWHLVRRNWGHGEDRRYSAMRVGRGERQFAAYSLRMVFLLQGLVMWFVSLPVQVGIALPAQDSPGWLAWLGIGTWSVGLFFEAVGDWQLARFKADPANRGKVMDRGLWRYTRHPNYFGDACVWWGLYLVAADAGWPGLTLLSPLVMNVFLLKVTGKALLEKDLSARPGYLDYIRRTSGFFPLPPRA